MDDVGGSYLRFVDSQVACRSEMQTATWCATIRVMGISCVDFDFL
jgi:hypothetical protein